MLVPVIGWVIILIMAFIFTGTILGHMFILAYKYHAKKKGLLIWIAICIGIWVWVFLSCPLTEIPFACTIKASS